MWKCKLCRMDLYSEISFSNIFKMNYEVHRSCLEKLRYNYEELVIPIDSNIIIYDCVFSRENKDFDDDYLWFNYLGEMINKHLKSREWSIVIIYDKMIEEFVKKINPYLLLNLSVNPILLISLFEKSTSPLEVL